MTEPQVHESKLYRTLRERLTEARDGYTITFLDHLCQEVRQIIADELTRNQPERATHTIGNKDRRVWDQSIGFDHGWDAARNNVLMPIPPLS